MDRVLLKAEIARDEGLRLKPYRDTVGVLTIGYGRNLDANGIRKSEAEDMLENDISAAIQTLTALWPAWVHAAPARQHALLNMAFNLGQAKLARFTRMWAAIRAGDWDQAADHALNSKWATQVGKRAVRVMQAFRLGTFTTEV